MQREIKVAIFQSFQEENKAEDRRRAQRTVEERLIEFESLQERMWGESWRASPMVKVATWEKVDW